MDYAAVYVFDTFCKNEYTSNRQKKNRWYEKPAFIITDDQENFKDEMYKKFKYLFENHSKIYNVFEKTQSFNGDPWLNDLTNLVNTSKHRHLTKQTKETTTKFSMQYAGITINNATSISRNDGTLVNINGTKVDLVNPSPYDHLFSDTSVSVEYFFEVSEVSELSVLPTLHAIYIGTNLVITDLEKLLLEGINPPLPTVTLHMISGSYCRKHSSLLKYNIYTNHSLFRLSN